MTSRFSIRQANRSPQVYWAIKNRQHDTLKRLVEYGTDVNMLDERGYSSINVGTEFYYCGLETTKACVKVGHWGAQFSPLVCAAIHGRKSMVKYLLDHGAKTELKGRKLCNCCHDLLRCPEMLPDLPGFYERDPDAEDDRMSEWVNAEEYVPDWTPLHYAICNQHVSTAKLLIERGANAGCVGGHVTALHVATRWEVDELIEYLLEHNLVEINAQNYHGVTALHLAHIAGRYDLVDTYLDHGADINLAYSEESGPWTIFSMACAEGLFERALEYLRRGADPTFVLEGEDDDPWTVMRLIYWPRESDMYLYPLPNADERMNLEKEIMAVIRRTPPEA